ncbi:MAG: type II toxin-antitoxin system HipA family toxin [Campylobacterota bacterium]|nr:type II toxin-antitoxin system HipA family toxin [Campylobacterota bacterium]
MKERILIPTIFGEEIGVLMEGKNGLSFQYHKSFNAIKYPISPLCLPYEPTRVFNYYDSMPFNGLPGVFADSLPDSFGNIALREYFYRKYSNSQLKLSPLEKLAYVGSNGIGAIEYKPAIDEKDDTYKKAIDLQQYTQETKHLIEGNANDVLYALVAHPSPGGARPKAAVLWNKEDNSICLRNKEKSGFEHWIIKFDEEDREETKLEYLYMTLAKEIGIHVPDTKQIYLENEVHFASKRFDRFAGDKLHQITLAGLIHGDFMRQNSCSYEEYLRIAEVLTKSPNATKEAYRRMVFNVIGKNCDDHIKNFSFLMGNDGKWKISPAYDLLYSFGPVTYGEHKMSINGKNSHININDLAQCGYSVGLTKRFMIDTIDEVSEHFSNIEKALIEADISNKLRQEMISEITPLLTKSFPVYKPSRRHRPPRFY